MPARPARSCSSRPAPFIINSGNFLLINKGITLRGAGPGQTTLAKTNGAKPFQEAVSANPSPLIIVGPHRFSSPGPHRISPPRPT